MWTTKRDRSKSDRIWLFCDGSTGMLPAVAGAKPGKARELPDGAALHHLRKRFAAQSRCAAAAIARRDDGSIVDWRWQALPAITNNKMKPVALLLEIIKVAANRAGRAQYRVQLIAVFFNRDGSATRDHRHLDTFGDLDFTFKFLLLCRCFLELLDVNL